MEDGPGLHHGQYGSSSGIMSIGVNKQPEDQGSRPQYSMPGILHFLQTEWARFEMERSQWEVERAELQVNLFDCVLSASILCTLLLCSNAHVVDVNVSPCLGFRDWPIMCWKLCFILTCFRCQCRHLEFKYGGVCQDSGCQKDLCHYFDSLMVAVCDSELRALVIKLYLSFPYHSWQSYAYIYYRQHYI